MASDVKFKMTGHKELIAKLNSMDRKMRRTISTKAVRAGAKVTVKALRAAAPKDSGKGAKAIGSKVKTYRNNGVTVAISGERRTVVNRSKEPKNKAKYGGPHFHLIEYGTGERFRTGMKAAKRSGNAELIRKATTLRNIQKKINKLGTLGLRVGKFTSERLGTGATGRVTAKPFFQRAWRSSVGAMQAAQVAVLRREIEAAARGGA